MKSCVSSCIGGIKFGGKMSQGGQVPPAPPPPPPNFAPPPPPAPTGTIPAVRLKSEIPDRRMEPPACVQNAMMTKDKKPFTYTPGGLDLSQIRSPRMARRIERNAHSEGVSETPRPPPPQQQPGPLPPSAMAAMQPQLPIQVFPTGGPPPPPPIPPANNNHHAPKPPPMRAVSPQNIPQQPFQRPDIKIPANPTAMLRPTAGINRPSFDDFDKDVEPHRGPQATAVTMTPRYSPPSPETQTSTAQLGSLYIPPVEGYKHVQAQAPPPPPQRQIQSPTSPQSPIQGLNKAPTPWLQKQQVQPTVPAWAVRSESVSSPSPPIQQSQNHSAPTWSPSPPISQSPGPRVIPMQFEAVPVQPQQQQQQQRVVQQQSHQQSQQRTESTTTRIIPIQIEGAPQRGNQQAQRQVQPVYVHNKFNPPSGPNTPSTPGSDRNLSRQQSWSANPTQSNAFKMIQKITNTDGEEEDDDAPITEHGPRQFQQMPTEQVRKMNLTDSDRQLMNRVRQVSEDASFWQDDDLRYRGGHIPSRVFRLLDESGVDNDTFLHNEVDPRYRGAAIPSRAFRLLQNMTDGASDVAQATSVPRGQPNTRGPPQVREHIIHTQIEGDGPPKPYIPPSEQTVQEPRKYTGSAIPSRSFKMLQAMTAPENCAVPPTENNENYTHDPSNYGNWAYDPNYAPPYWPYPPYWGYYDPNAYAQTTEPHQTSSPNPNTKSKSSEDVPDELNSAENKSEQEKQTNGAETPCSFANDMNYQYYPYWDPYSGYQEQSDTENTAPAENGVSRSQCSTPAFWDPYGYAYYYGYPPVYPYPAYSPYFFYQNTSDPEDVNGYSSNDEMSYYASKFAKRAEQQSQKVVEVETPSIIVTPTPTPGPQQTERSRKNSGAKKEKETKKYLEVNSDSESDDTEVDDDEEMDAKSPRVSNSSSLQSIPSVTNIKVYEKDESELEGNEELEPETETETEYEEAEDAEPEEVEECEIEEPESEETSEETPDDDDVSIYINTDGIVPHQLSVIYEESERGSMSGSKCEHSMSQTSLDTVVSEGGSTSTIENAENEESDYEDVDPQSSTVTVRLPLKLKFSVTENDEAVTTVTVGDSEVNMLKLPTEDSETDVHTQVTLKSPSRTPTRDLGPFIAEEEEEDENVTVTVNVRSRSSSVKRVLADPDDDISVDENPLARTFSTDNYDTADSDAEVSICISIPLSVKKSPRDVVDSDESDDEIEVKKTSKKCQKPLLPQSINKDEDVSLWVNLTNERVVDKDDQEEGDWCGSIKTMENEAKNSQSEDEYEDQDEEKDEQEDSEDETKEVIKVEVKKKEVVPVKEIVKTETKIKDVVSVKDVNVLKRNEDVSDDESESSESSSASSSDSSSSRRKDRRESVRKLSVKEKQSDSTIVEEKPIIINDKKEKEESKISIIKESSSDSDMNNNDKSDSSESVFEKPESKVDLMSIKGRIAALQKASKASYKPKANDNSKLSVKDRVSMIEEIQTLAKEIETNEVITGTPVTITTTATTTTTTTCQKSTKGSVKSSEEFSEEEEVDSGVTSDMSRHISETDTESDCFPELRKLTRYQRAATHSRLFKLLQDECGDDNNEEECLIAEPPKRVHDVSITRRNAAAAAALSSDEEPKETKSESMLIRREHLSLPLKSNPSGSDSFSSSGITSPGSPTVNEKLVAELVQSMLKRKKGRIYRNIPLEKLHAAALRILQEDMDRGDTVSSSEDGGSTHISPLRPDTMNSTPAQTPQEFYGNNYNEYCHLYESWNEATQLYDTHYDILPSRAFKLLQEHALGDNKAGAINGLSAKCPRVLSAKNLHKEIERLLEDVANTTQSSSSPIPEPTLAPKEATAS